MDQNPLTMVHDSDSNWHYCNRISIDSRRFDNLETNVDCGILNIGNRFIYHAFTMRLYFKNLDMTFAK